MRPEFLSLSRSGKQRSGAESRDSERKQEDKMGKYFGTDGYRGEANVNLTADDAFKVGKFLAYYFSEKGKKDCRIVIGKDTRRSSYMFEYALSAGITAAGADATLCT